MSIESEITRISDNIEATYAAAENLGATMPEQQNSDNLASTVSSIANALTPYENQNAFSKVAVGETTIEADNPIDTLTLEAGDNIIITPDIDNDKITIATDGDVITELTDQYVTVWNLDAGIYNWTYSGQKVMYFNGTSTTASIPIGDNQTREVILTVMNYVTSTSAYKAWEARVVGGMGTANKYTLYYGNTTESFGTYWSRDLSNIPTSTITVKPTVNSSAQQVIGHYTATSGVNLLNTDTYLYAGEYGLFCQSMSTANGFPYDKAGVAFLFLKTYNSYTGAGNSVYASVIKQELNVLSDKREFERYVTYDGSTYTYGEWTETTPAERVIELTGQYVRVWDLDAGIYKWTYDGQKYLYYDGSSSESTIDMGSSYLKTAILIVRDFDNGVLNKHWHVYSSSNNGYSKCADIIYGTTNSSLGQYQTRSFYNIPTVYGVKAPACSSSQYAVGFCYSTNNLSATSSALNTAIYLYAGEYGIGLSAGSKTTTNGYPYDLAANRRAVIKTYNSYSGVGNATYSPVIKQELFIATDNRTFVRYVSYESSSSFTYGEWIETTPGASSGGATLIWSGTSTEATNVNFDDDSVLLVRTSEGDVIVSESNKTQTFTSNDGEVFAVLNCTVTKDATNKTVSTSASNYRVFEYTDTGLSRLKSAETATYNIWIKEIYKL